MAEVHDNPWEDLVVSILSVNQYSLEKTYAAVEALRHEGLVRAENLAEWSKEEIEVRLRRAHFDRGTFMTALFSLRLAHLGAFIKKIGLAECEKVLRVGETDEVRRLLMPVNGVGPKVLASFFLLRGSGYSGL